MSAIGKGSIVQCIRGSTRGIEGGRELAIGALYRCASAGHTATDRFGVEHEALTLDGILSALPHRRGSLALYDVSLFRPWPPASDAELLLENLPAELEREGVSA